MRASTYQFTFSAGEKLQSEESVRNALDSIVIMADLNKVNEVLHDFEPQGMSLVYVLAESHIAIHTWPEENYAYITLSSCKSAELDTEQASNKLRIR